jgi:HK97 family phage major capsid protein
MKTVELTEDLVRDLKGALALVKEKGEAITQLETAVGAIENKLLALAQTPTFRPKELLQWDSEAQAKKFVDLCRDLFPANSKALVGGVDADGGYTVPEEFRAVLIRLIDEFGQVRRAATVFPMATDTVKLAKLTSGLAVTWPGEGVAIVPPSNPVFGQLTLSVKKMAALIGTSTELLEDSNIDIANLIATLVAEAMAKEEDRVGLLGDTGAGDAFMGVLNVAGTTSFTMAAGKTAFDDLTADDCLDLIRVTPIQGHAGGAFWMHRSIQDVVRKLRTTSGEYIYNQPANGAPPTLWGYPIVTHELMPSIVTAVQAGVPFMFFGNMKKMYMTDRRRMTAAVSTHHGFAEDQVWYRWTQRIGFHFPLPTLFSKMVTAAV